MDPPSITWKIIEKGVRERGVEPAGLGRGGRGGARWAEAGPLALRGAGWRFEKGLFIADRWSGGGRLFCWSQRGELFSLGVGCW